MADKMTKFRKEFKRYKQRKPPADFSEVIDFENQNSWKGRVKECEVSLLDVNNQEIDQDFMQSGLKSLNTWRCYELDGFEGFKVIINPFTKTGQLEWIKQCLQVYPSKPNVCNLDAHMELKDEENLWHLYEKRKSNKESTSPLQKSKQCQTLMDQLRWVTLGYHYNWDSKFPAGLQQLTKCIARAMAYSKLISTKNNGIGGSMKLLVTSVLVPDKSSEFGVGLLLVESFIPEAAIINYYHMDSTLSGHTDHSEFDLTAPLFSLSFGQSCIFLLGTQALDDMPSAMFLRNGDIVMMSGETRLAYHAVPRILPDKDVLELTKQVDGDQTLNKTQSMEFIERYLSYSRINVNIRQVEGPEGRFPVEES